MDDAREVWLYDVASANWTRWSEANTATDSGVGGGSGGPPRRPRSANEFSCCPSRTCAAGPLIPSIKPGSTGHARRPCSHPDCQMASGNGSARRPSARHDSVCRVLPSRQAFHALMAMATSARARRASNTGHVGCPTSGCAASAPGARGAVPRQSSGAPRQTRLGWLLVRRHAANSSIWSAWIVWLGDALDDEQSHKDDRAQRNCHRRGEL